MQTPSNRFSRYALQSLLLHAAFLAVGVYLLHEKILEPPKSKLAGPISVALLHGAFQASQAPSPPSASPKVASKSRLARKLPLQFGPSFSLNPGAASPPSYPASHLGNGSGGGGQEGPRDGYEVSNAMGIVEESRLYPFFSALWKKIDASADYPPDFVRERLTGYVTAQLVVDRKGVFTGSINRVYSDQPLLETYILAVLFHALSEPLPRGLWTDREQVILVSRFDFHTFSWGQVPPARRQKETKNVLEFERYGYVEPKVNQVIEKFVTHYMPPIIPLPGAFYIDFIRTYEFLHNINNQKMGEDDLRLERIELKREQWESLIHKSSQQAATLQPE